MAVVFDSTKLVTMGQLKMALERIEEIIEGYHNPDTDTEPGPEVPEPEVGTSAITLTKLVEGETEADEFEFDITLGGTTTHITLSKDQEYSTDVEAGTEYTITETDSKNADSILWVIEDNDEPVEGDTVFGTVGEDELINITVINTFEGEEPEPEPEPEPNPDHTGNLTILKQIDGETDATAFEFELTIGDEVKTFTLDGDANETFEDIESGTEYTITEVDSKGADSVSYSIDDDDPIEGTSYIGVIGEDVDTDITFINTFIGEEPEPEPVKGKLIVTKKVEGDPTETQFVIEISDDTDAFDQAILEDGESHTFELTAGEVYHVRELNSDAADNVTYSIDGGEAVEGDTADVTIEEDTETTVLFTNIYDEVEPSPCVVLLTKKVDGDTEDSDYSFEITDSDGNVVGDAVLNNDETEEFVLDAGTYTITETDTKNTDFVKYVVDGGKPVIDKSVEIEATSDDFIEVICTNAYYAPETVPPEDDGTLVISKSVSGDTEDSDYVIEVTDSDGNVVASETFNDGDSKEFSLVGGFYTITETDPKSAELIKYSVNGGTEVSGSSVTLEVPANKTTEVAFINGYYQPETVPPDPEPDPEPTPDPEPEPDKTGILTISKKTEVSPVDKTDKGTFKFELTVGDDETEEIELAAGDSVDKEILADTEFTLKEVESNEADMVTYAVDGGDSVEGDTVTGTVSEDGNISVDFLNRYIYLYLNPNHTTMTANSGTLTVVLNTNGTPTVTCDNDEMVDWTLSGKTLKINGSKSSPDDYTAVFTITSTLSNGAEIVGTYTIYFTADEEKLDDLVLNPDSSTATAGFSPITIVFSTNGTPSVECDSDKVEWELKEPGGIFTGYQLVINNSEESDVDYVVHFTITCTLGDDQSTSAVYTLTFTANS